MYEPLYSMPIGEVSDDGIIASKSGAITAAYHFQKPAGPIAGEDHDAATLILAKALGQLPTHTVVHFQDYYWQRKWKPQSDPNPKPFLAQSSDEHFSARPFLDNEGYLLVTLPPPGSIVSKWGSSAFLRRNLQPPTVLDEKTQCQFLEAVGQFQAALSASPLFQLERLSKVELTGDKTTSGLIERYWNLTPPSESPVIGDIDFERDGVRVLGRTFGIYTLADAELLPENCQPWTRFHPYSTTHTTVPTGFASWLGPLLNTPHCTNVYVIIEDCNKLLTELEKKRKRLDSAAGQSRENTVARDAIAQYLQEAALGQRTPVRVHVNVLAWAEDDPHIPVIKQLVSAAVSRLGAIPRLEALGAPQLWYAGIPGNADQLPRADSFISFAEQAACFVIKEGTGQDSISSFGMRLCDRETGRPLDVDISDEPKRKQWTNNLNKFVLAGSGGGKSYLICLYVRHLYEQGAHAVIIDVGGSYKSLCTLLNGQYFAYTEQHPIRLNPFQLENGETPDIEKKESQISLLIALWKKSDETFHRSEYVALSNALHGFYTRQKERPEIAPCFNAFYDYVRDVFASELTKLHVTKAEFDIDNFLYVLRPYYTGGEYDYLLNATDQPSLLQERLIVFDIDAIKDHPILFPVVTIVIMELFISKMRRLHGVRKVIVIEEAWKAIAKEGMDEYIKYLFKTVRKFFGEAIVVTQELEDIISSPVVKNTIINNADCKILLDQSKLVNRFDTIQQLLGLSEFAKAMVLSLNKSNDPGRKYKEVAICYANGKCQVYGVETSLEEYLTFTTEESERVVVQQYAQQEGGLEKGIRALAGKIRSGAVKLFLVLMLLFLQKPASAQVLEIADLINAAVKKVIVAADLQVQRLQTQTIALQDAAKALENSMAGDLLGDITDWVQQEEDLYGAYYQELWQVKSALSAYSKTATLIERQLQLVKEEQQDWAAVQRDPHFSVAELEQIAADYTGILNESKRNVQQIELVINTFVTQMDDAGRLGLIDEANRGIDGNYQDLRQFTQENSLLSIQRAKDENDLLTIKALYNLP
jgi:conjugation system TraG family ATPase